MRNINTFITLFALVGLFTDQAFFTRLAGTLMARPFIKLAYIFAFLRLRQTLITLLTLLCFYDLLATIEPVDF